MIGDSSFRVNPCVNEMQEWRIWRSYELNAKVFQSLHFSSLPTMALSCESPFNVSADRQVAYLGRSMHASLDGIG